jgi:hypothetical protein
MPGVITTPVSQSTCTDRLYSLTGPKNQLNACFLHVWDMLAFDALQGTVRLQTISVGHRGAEWPRRYIIPIETSHTIEPLRSASTTRHIPENILSRYE